MPRTMKGAEDDVWADRRCGPIRRKAPTIASRAWTLFWLVAPLPLLFHPPFLRGIVWPLVGLSLSS